MSSVLVEPIALTPIEDPADAGEGVGADMAMVGHVQVRLSATLGEAELALSDLFALKTGQIVELDRLLHDPVTLSLHGRPVATAHLVAVGDRFGVQIVQVLGQG